MSSIHKGNLSSYKIIVVLLMGIFMISFISASSIYIGNYPITHPQDDCFNINIPCDNCTYMNISVFYPNGTEIIENQEMTNLTSTFSYNYSFCDTSELGIYSIITHYDEDGAYLYSDSDYFTITPSGEELSNYGFVSTGALFILFAFAILSFIFAFKVDSKGFKIFLMLLGYIFLYSTLSLALIFFQATLLEGAINMINIFITVFSILFFVIFMYVIVMFIIEILENIKKKRGLKF